MLFELHLAEPYDGLTRILQVLRLAECRIRRIDAAETGDAHRIRLDLDVSEERSDLVKARLAGIIGVQMLSIQKVERNILQIAA